MTAFQPGSPAYEALIAERDELRSDNERLRERVADLQATSGYEASIAQLQNERLREALQAISDRIPGLGYEGVGEIARRALP